MSFDDALGQPLGINPTEYVNDLIQNQAGGARPPGVGVNPTVEVNRLLRKGLQGQRPPEPEPLKPLPETPQTPSVPGIPGERSFREYGEPIEAPSSTPGEGARPAGQSTPPAGQQGKGQFSEYGEPVDMGGDQMPGVIQAAGQGLKRGGQELSQTAEMLGRSRPELTAENDPEYAMTAGAIGAPIPTQATAPRPELPPPMQPLPAETSTAAKPVTWGDFLHPMSMLPKLAYQTGHGAAQIAGAAGAGAIGAAAGGPIAGAGAAGVVAGGITIAQQLGPYYMEALKETGDPDKAYDIAIRKADLDGVISAAAFAAFGVAPFNGFLKNLLFQSFVAQPSAAVGGKVAKNVQEGKPFEEGTGEEVPGAIAGTLIPGAAMHAALHGRGPNRTAEPGKPVEEDLSNNPEEFFKRGGRTESWPPEPPPKTGGPGAAETPPRTPRETIEEFIRQRDTASAEGRSKEFQDAARAAEDKAKAGGRDIMEALDEFLKQNAKAENPHTAQAKNEENLANQGYRRKQEEEQAARTKAAFNDTEQKPWTPADGNPWGMTDEEYAAWKQQPENRAAAEDWDRQKAEMEKIGQAPSENEAKPPESGEKPAAPQSAESPGTHGTPGAQQGTGTGQSAIELKTGADVARAAAQASQNHTHEQGEAQTYQMGKATWEGLPISFEAPAGGVRRGVNPKTGERWEAKVGSATGFIEGTKGGDGQELDINFGPHPDSPTVFVINENDQKTGEYKQTKSFAGFKTARAATNAYLGSGGKTREQIASIVPMDRAQFKDWVETADHTKPAEAKKGEPAAAESTPAGSQPQGVNGAEGVAPEAANDKAEVNVGSPSGTRHNQEEISAPEAREIHQHRQAVEDAIRARGEDPDALRPVDLHRAAEIMAHEGYGPDDAFQIAIARAFLEDGHLTPEQVQEFYGKNAEAILHPKPASERGVRAEASGAATGGPAAETGKAQAVEGAAERPPGGGEAGQGPGQAGEAVAGGTADIPPGQESHPGGGTTDQVSHPEHAVGGAPGGTEAAERPVEEGNTRPAKTAKRPVKPHSLLEFIAAQGGLKPTPELRDLELPKSVTVPGLGWRSLIRGAGHDLDTMRRKAVEAGYVWDEPDRVGGGVSTPNDLLEKIAAEAKGHRQMAVGEEEHKTARQREIEQETGENRAEALRRQRKRLEDYVKSTGAPIDAFHSEDIHDAIEMMEDRGLPPERAIEAAWMRNNAREDLAPGEEFIDNYGEEPFHDEVHGATAPGHGEETEPAGGRRPEGEESRPAEPGPRGIGVGAAGGQERERLEPEGGGERTSGEVWWDHELTRAGRRDLILRAFGERDIIVPDRIRWHYLKPEEQEKLLALRDTEATPAGEQHILPGTEKIGEGEQAQIKADKPLKPKVAQKPADEGLFGEHGQTDLVDMAKTPSSDDKRVKREYEQLKARGLSDQAIKEDFTGLYDAAKALGLTEKEAPPKPAAAAPIETIPGDGLEALIFQNTDSMTFNVMFRDTDSGNMLPSGHVKIGTIVKARAIALEVLEGKRTAAEPEAEKPPEPKAAEPPASADVALARALVGLLKAGKPISNKALQEAATAAYGGKLAEGKFDRKDAHDALELAVNMLVKEEPGLRVMLNGGWERAQQELEKMLDRLPTQTVRSEEQVSFQQFSTPPTYSMAAAYAANLRDGDVVLEPSAGTGSLVAAAERPGVRFIANEVSPRRAELLRALVGKDGKVYTENAEQIDNILKEQPTVVVMNPPFSRTAGRMGDKKVIGAGAAHLEAALNLLAPGGRLVAILGRGMAPDANKFKDWWQKIGAKNTVRANIGVDGDVYKKYGTHFGTRLVVIDKVPPTGGKPVVVEVKTVADLMRALEPIRETRPEQRSSEQGRPALVAGSEGGRSELSTSPESGVLGPGTGRPGGVAGAGPSGGRGAAGPTPGVEAGERPGVVAGEPGGAKPAGTAGKPSAGDQGGGKPTEGGGGNPERDLQPGAVGKPGAAAGSERIELEHAAPGSQTASAITDSLYESYEPKKVKIKGAKKHPGPLVESAAMASVDAPDPTYRPTLPKDVVEKGLLSIAQIEAVVYAGQAHQSMLPAAEGLGAPRRGFFIGDGTGVGKGREIAGVILDNWQQGRHKAVWVSEKKKLLNDAKRDWDGLGQDKKLLFDVGKTKTGEPVKAERGIAFVTYDTLKGGMSEQAAVSRGGLPKGTEVRDKTTGQIWTITGKATKDNYHPVKNKTTGETGNIPRPLLEPVGEIAEVKSRVDQIVDWFGADFDGVIAFDESHNMGNATAEKGSRGQKDAALKALAGLELQNRLPNARVVYVSATGATEVSNLAYAERLGLWGRGTAFASRQNFVGEVEGGGVAAMELIARDMKNMGLYMARNLSYDGVEYSRLQHTLDKAQREIYDTAAEAWQIVLKNIEVALQLTGGDKNSRAKSAAKSAFWGAHQRFFNQIITSLQMPTVIKAVEKDLDAGRQVVLQLTNTNEASQERAAAKAETAEDIEDLDITPRDQIIQLIEHSFPTQEYEEYVDEAGNEGVRPVFDSDGNPVQNKEAVAMREALIDRLASLRVPQGPLDLVLDHFGHEIAAEVTGRGRRFILKTDDKTGQRKRVEESRPASANQSEIDKFQAGKKKVLVFSEAGGTGASYHADNGSDSKNARRAHYLVQAGWRADKAVQGFGRTHRTNQASAPIFHLVSTDLDGQKRFISSIARRLGQLGALTKGQRQAGDQGIFSARDNLESREAKTALQQFFAELYNGRIEGINIDEFERQTGLMLRQRDKDGGILGLRTDLPPITQFLNRLLSMKIEQQNGTFRAFSEILDNVIEARQAAGLLDVGLETVRAEKIAKQSEQTVHTDKESGAETKYVKLALSDKFIPTPFKNIANNNLWPVKRWVTSPTGKIYAATEAPDKTEGDTGRIVPQFRLMSPVSGTRYEPRETVTKGPKWGNVDPGKAREMWESETAAAPEFITRDMHLITGAVLPVWDRLKGSSRIVRLNTDEGERMIGRVVPSRDLAATLKALGAEAKGEKVTPGKLFDTIMAGGRAEMANGWSLSRRTVAGEHRIEVKGPRTYSEGQEIKQDGVFTERIAYETRYFVPTDPAVGKKVLERLTQYRPVTVLEGGESPEAGVAESTIPFGADNGLSQNAGTGVLDYVPLKPPVIKSNHGAAAQKLVLEKGRETGIEYLMAFDARGAVVQHGSGTENSVGFSDELNKLVADPAQDIVLHHNHPSNSVLSRRDVAMMGAPGLKVVWAHGHDGSVSRAELTPRMRAVVLQGSPKQAKDGLWKIAQGIADALHDPIYDAAVQNGKLSPEAAGRLHNHLINVVMHRAGAIDYQSNIDADADVAEFGLERHISDIASKLRASFPHESKPGTDRRAGRVRYIGDVGAVFGDPQTVASRNGPQIADDRGGRADDRKKAPPVAPSLRDSFADEVESFGTPLAKQHRAQVEERLRDLATHLMGPRANVEFPQTIPMDAPPPGYGAARGNARSFAGQYIPASDLVKIALGDPKWRDPQSNVNHEAFHWVEDHFATPQEMAVAVREDASLRRYVEQYLQVQKGDLAPMSSFEIRAYAFMRYMDEQHRGIPSYGVHAGLRRFFQRGTDFFKRVRNSLADLGFTTTNDFFRDIAAGEVAKRPDRMLDQGKPSRVLAQAHTNDPEEQERRAVAMAIPIPPKVASIFERFMEGTQDLSRRVQQLEDDIRARNAGVLPDSRAFYEMKRLFPGKRDIRVREFNAAHMKPLFAHLDANKISGKEFGQYLYARHAIERNEKLGQLYPPTHQFHIAMSDPSVVGASGMSANEARAIITRAMTAPNRQGYIDGTARVHRIIDFINSAMVAGELETQGTIDAWNAMYREYVPLSGFEDEDEDPGARTGGNFDVRGKEVKQAFGRGSKAANPLENLLNLAYRTIERAEKNRYKRSLADAISGLSQADRDDIGVKINRGELKKQINRATGRIEMVPDPGARFSPHSVHFKVMGQSWFIHFEDRTLAESINRMSPDQMNPFMQGILNMQNHLKALWTHYSPDFLIRHFLFRYPIEAAMNAIETEGVKGAAKIWWKGQPLGSEAVRAIFRNSGTEAIDRYWTEMKAQGGAMMFRNMRDMDLMREDLKLGLRALRGGPAKTVLDKLAAAREAMDHVTNTLDNALRLSVYASARDRGVSPQKAAVMAREATVDFQLKGKWANMIGLWFPFGNVAIQTSARMLKAVERSKVMKQVFVGTMAAGFALSAWNYLGGGVDTDGTPFFEKVPEWERRMNFIIMNPFNPDSEGRPDVIKIPMPYNWAMPLSIGYASGGVVFGKLGVADALGQALHSSLEALTPAGAMENKADLLSPEILRPIAHLATNRDAFNRPIHAEEKFGNQKQPNSYSGKKDFRGIERTGYGWKYIAESLNDLTGGHPHKQGWIDFYPEDIREVFDYAFGTQKRLIQNVIKTGQDATEGKHDPTHVPLERVFHGTDYDAADRAAGYERSDRAKHNWKR